MRRGTVLFLIIVDVSEYEMAADGIIDFETKLANVRTYVDLQ